MKPSLIIIITILALSLSGRAAELSLESCAAIEDPGERFTCYDTLAGRLPADKPKVNDTAPAAVNPVKPGASVIAPAETQTVTAVDPAPDESIFGLEHKQKPKEDRLQLRWTRKEKDAHGKWIIFMENGQVWRQTDTRRIDFNNSEQMVVVSRGFAGGFFLSEPDSRLRIRVKRVK